MSVVLRRAVPVAALVACALLPAVAHAQAAQDGLVAQIAQVDAAPTPGGQPPLRDEPPVPLRTPTPTPTPTPTATATATPAPGPAATATAAPGGRRRGGLARTGSDAGLVALAGLSLLGMGLSLRWAVPDGAPR